MKNRARAWLSLSAVLLLSRGASAGDCIKAQTYVTRAAEALAKDPAAAEELYSQAADLCPESAAVQYDLGLARFDKEDYPEAISAFRAALKLRPDFAEAMNALAVADMTVGIDWDQAKSLIERALKLRPQDDVLLETKRSLALEEKVHRLRGATAERKNAYAVVVGIENYRDLPKVDTADNDAKWVREYFIKKLGVPEENLVSLSDSRASRADMIKYFEVWLKNNVTEGSSVYVYYAGHGAPDVKTKKGFLIPYDGDPNYLADTAYPLDSLYASLSKLPAKEVTVFLDSCFSGADGTIAKGTRPLVPVMESALPATGKMIVMAAAQGTQTSSAYDEAGHGLFTYFLLRGLNGDADVKGKGSVDVQDLYDYLRPAVSGMARRMNREQNPTLLPAPKDGSALLQRRLTAAPGKGE